MKERKCRKALFSIFLRSFFLQAIWNFERMQNIGFAYGLMPLFRILYPEPAKRKKAILRHLEFFNTNPYIVSIVFGFVASMEEELNNGKDIGPEKITAIKTNIAGPLAAIGDKLFWATWRPFTALLSIALILFFYNAETFCGTWLPPLFFLVVYNLFLFPFRYWSLKLSYHYHRKIVKMMASLEFKFIIDIIRYTGLIFLVLIILYYLTSFIPVDTFNLDAAISFNGFALNFQWLILFIFVFLLSIMLMCLRTPAEIMVYCIILFSIGLSWLKYNI